MYSSFLDMVRGLYETSDFIPLHQPRFVGNEKKYLSECIDSTFVSSVGEYVSWVEEKIAAELNVKHAIMTMNGTAALHLCLLGADVLTNDEVITQPLTFVATCNAIKYCGAYPVFVDIEQSSLGLSPEKLVAFLDNKTMLKEGRRYNRETGRRVQAVLPMHTFGHPCRIDELKEICDAYGLVLIEDSAEALGSLYHGRHVGGFGRLGALSFNGNKIITSGGGGAVLTNDDVLAKKIKHLSTTAKKSHPWAFEHDEIGFNYRMPNLNAALLIAQLESLPSILENKRWVASQYEQFFKDIDWARFIKEPDGAHSNYWLNTICFENLSERERFLTITNNERVMTRPAWTLMPDLPMFSDAHCEDIDVARYLAQRLVNIPSSARLE